MNQLIDRTKTQATYLGSKKTGGHLSQIATRSGMLNIADRPLI